MSEQNVPEISPSDVIIYDTLLHDEVTPEVVIPEIFLTFEEKLAHIASYDYKTERTEWDEAITDVLQFFLSIVKQLVEATIRLEEYEEGFKFADKLPDVGTKIIYEWMDRSLSMRYFDGKSGNHITLHDEYYNESIYDITDGRFAYRWHPVPVSAESLESHPVEVTDYVTGKGE